MILQLSDMVLSSFVLFDCLSSDIDEHALELHLSRSLFYVQVTVSLLFVSVFVVGCDLRLFHGASRKRPLLGT